MDISIKDFGIQLWSVRDETEKDFYGTLKQLSEMGYKGVEFAGYGGKPASEMKAKLDEYGLIAMGSHVGYDRFKNNLAEEIAYNTEIGNKYMICPWAKVETRQEVDELAELLESASVEAAKFGLKVGYHNHDHEFVKIDGEYPLDLLIQQTKNVVFQIDIYWVEHAGVDCIEYIKKWGDRIELVHLKQINEEKKQVDFADGNIDMGEVINNSKFAKYFVVEQEEFEVSSMVSAKNDIEFLL